jgi:hypothetical protein
LGENETAYVLALVHKQKASMLEDLVFGGVKDTPFPPSHS